MGAVGQIQFYLNYEECKYKKIDTLMVAQTRFILTMRNVNSNVALYDG